MGFLGDILRETWLVAARMSPYLLFGFLVAGVLSVVANPAWLERHLGGRGAGPVVKASLLGVPLPLCSCGVIPVAASLRSHGASRAATTSFLLSTPQTGVDSILVTWTMLGPVFAVVRPVVALATGLLGGGLVAAFAPGPAPSPAPFPLAGAAAAPTGRRSPRDLAVEALRYGFVTLPADLGRALLVGVVLAGVIGAVVPPNFVARWVPPGPLAVLLMMAIGIPMYVCATASVPVAAGLIHLGVSPGAALAFLIAGPATNAATFTTIGRVLGRRALGMFLATIAVSAFGSGLLLDALWPRLGSLLPAGDALPHHHEPMGWWSHVAAAALVAVVGLAWWSVRRPRAAVAVTAASAPPAAFAVEGMNCSHCVQSVRRAVGELPGVAGCDVDLEAGRAVVTGAGVDPAAVVAAIEALGFRARPGL